MSNSQKPKAIKGNQYTGKMVMDSGVDNQKSKTKTIQDLGFNQKQAERFETLNIIKYFSVNHRAAAKQS